MSSVASISFFRKLSNIALGATLAVLFTPNYTMAQSMVPAPSAPVSENGAPPSITYNNQNAPVAMQQPMLAQPVMVAPAMDIPSFTPVEGWQVTKTSLAQARGLQNVRLPCLMTSEFDNGFIVRLSGGGGNILAMAIDFRQRLFKPGTNITLLLPLAE